MGGLAEVFTHEESFSTVDELWDWIHSHAQTDNVITCTTHPGSDTKYNEFMLPYGHAYTVIKSVQLSNGTRLVQVRNPWGRDSFNGDWSDTSPLWTDELAQEAGFTNDQQDGFIFLSIEDYYTQFR